MGKASLRVGAVCVLLQCAPQAYANVLGRRLKTVLTLKLGGCIFWGDRKIALGLNLILKGLWTITTITTSILHATQVGMLCSPLMLRAQVRGTFSCKTFSYCLTSPQQTGQKGQSYGAVCFRTEGVFHGSCRTKGGI